MTRFDLGLVTLNESFKGCFSEQRVRSMLLAALAVADGASGAEHKGVLLTEDEWLEVCRVLYRRVRHEIELRGSN